MKRSSVSRAEKKAQRRDVALAESVCTARLNVRGITGGLATKKLALGNCGAKDPRFHTDSAHCQKDHWRAGNKTRTFLGKLRGKCLQITRSLGYSVAVFRPMIEYLEAIVELRRLGINHKVIDVQCSLL
mmetsp:Transcript_11942/g.28016  ORF Transcript_11942/g.28016 Transcript_11942/m.28016 type:complete len:129 (+) Transcript_11942:1665-2051(+)